MNEVCLDEEWCLAFWCICWYGTPGIMVDTWKFDELNRSSHYARRVTDVMEEYLDTADEDGAFYLEKLFKV